MHGKLPVLNVHFELTAEFPDRRSVRVVSSAFHIIEGGSRTDRVVDESLSRRSVNRHPGPRSLYVVHGRAEHRARSLSPPRPYLLLPVLMGRWLRLRAGKDGVEGLDRSRNVPVLKPSPCPSRTCRYVAARGQNEGTKSSQNVTTTRRFMTIIPRASKRRCTRVRLPLPAPNQKTPTFRRLFRFSLLRIVRFVSYCAPVRYDKPGIEPTMPRRWRTRGRLFRIFTRGRVRGQPRGLRLKTRLRIRSYRQRLLEILRGNRAAPFVWLSMPTIHARSPGLLDAGAPRRARTMSSQVNLVTGVRYCGRELDGPSVGRGGHQQAKPSGSTFPTVRPFRCPYVRASRCLTIRGQGGDKNIPQCDNDAVFGAKRATFQARVAGSIPRRPLHPSTARSVCTS